MSGLTKKGFYPDVLVYAGKSYHGLKSAEYVSYDGACDPTSRIGFSGDMA